jgi:GH24 family phage-related lysozyme (muramidase)
MIDNGPALTQDNEGYVEGIYLDSLGFPTCGFGKLLDGRMAYKSVREWHEKIFYEEYSKAEAEYEKMGFDLDSIRRAAVVDLLYNLGPNRFSKFNGFIAALKMRDWGSAVNSLENSLWYRQVGRRGPRITKLIKEGRWDVL